MNFFSCTVIIELLVLGTQLSSICATEADKNSTQASKVKNLELNLHRVLEGARIRNKRKIRESYGSGDFQMRVESSAKADLPYLSDYRLTFWISVRHEENNQVLVGTEEGHLILFQFEGDDDKDALDVAISRNEPIASKAMAFSYGSVQWLAVQQPAGNKTWIHMYERVGRGLEGRQIISLDGKTSFDLISVKDTHYMAVATYQSSIYEDSLLLYQWRRTQFNIVASRVVVGARSVACWMLDGSLYMALAQEISNEGDFRVGSPVFFYNSKEESRLVLREVLETYGPKKVLHFYVGGSHYIIFIGNHDSTIYWWSNEQFLLWQTLPNTAHASDASVLKLENGEVVIVIAMQEYIWPFTLDSSGYYHTKFSFRISDFNLASLHFMYSGKAYYCLALFAASPKHPHPTWKFKFNSFFIPSTLSLDSLHKCSIDTGRVLDDRKGKIELILADLSRVWLKNKEQHITTKVSVIGTSTKKQVRVKQVLVLTNRKILPYSSIPNLEIEIINLEARSGDVNEIMAESVFKSIYQDIKGVKFFVNSLSIPSLNVESINQDINVNQLPISRVKDFALKKNEDQHFFNSVFLRDVQADVVALQNINQVPIDDFLLLNGQHHITGQLTFAGVEANSLYTQNINSIPVNSLVRVNQKQQIKDLKSFTHITSAAIEVHNDVNGENLKDLRSKILYVDGDLFLDSKYSLHSLTTVLGNLYFAALNRGSIDFSQIIGNTVNKHAEQKINGAVTFKSPISADFLTIDGLFNNVKLNNLLTKSTEQTVYGDLAFNGQLRIDHNLEVEYINGVNLKSESIVREASTQYIEGFKTFKNTIITGSIDLDEHVTLDGVDPSLLLQDIIQHKEGVVKDSNVIFRDIIVTGNLVSEDINRINILALPATLWLKSVDQVIEVPVNLEKMVVLRDITVNLINKFNVETELVSSYRDDVVLSVKSFSNYVTVKNNMTTEKEAMINGIDPVSLKQEKNEYLEEGTIRGRKILRTFGVQGDLQVVSFNGLTTLSDIMLPNIFQIVKGRKNFASELTTVSDGMQATGMEFKAWNGRNFQDYVNNSMVSPENKLSIGNKLFSKVKSNHLKMDPTSTLNSVPFSEMMERIVTLNSAQSISSGQAFLEFVHIEKPIHVGRLNYMNLNDYINRVVFKDVPGSIKWEQSFLGYVTTENILLHGYLNEINIQQLNKNVFFKSYENKVTTSVTLKSNTVIDELHATTMVDKIMWNDLMFFNEEETLGPIWLRSDTSVLGNVIVVGLLNGCDLNQLWDKAVYANHPNQIIKEEIIVESMEIIGNLHLTSVVNDMVMDELQKSLISISEDQVIHSDISLGYGISVINLQARDFINGVDLSSVIKDAVRHSVPQDIYGHKTFVYADADIMTVPDLTVHGEVNGVNVNRLYNEAVWKNGTQVIQGEKILFVLQSRIAEVKGHLNGLKLPQDIVLANVSEHIPAQVSMMTDALFMSDLNIHGSVDGISIDNLISSRVSLGSEETIQASLSFKDDVVLFGDLTVDGVINNIPLEMVAKVYQSLPLDGIKIFLENVKIHGFVFSSLLNGFDIKELVQNILNYKAPEQVKGLQTFEQPIQVINLFTERINGISLSDTASMFKSVRNSFSQMQSNFSELNSFQHQLNIQMKMSADQSSSFAYFTLVQDLKVPATKILKGPSFSNGTYLHSLVIWTNTKDCRHTKGCCHEEFSSWAKVQRNGYVIIDSDPQRGRIIPIDNAAHSIIDKDFFLWSNATDPTKKWCSRGNGEIHFVVYDKFGNTEVLRTQNSARINDAKSFWSDHLYAVVGLYNGKRDESQNTEIYVFSEKHEWIKHQQLSYGTHSMDIAYYEENNLNEILLAIGTTRDTSVYNWNRMEKKFIKLHSLPYKHTASVLWIKQESKLLLAVATAEQFLHKDADCFDLSGGEVNIFLYETNLKWIQSIPIEGVISLISFNLKGDTFFVAASTQLQTLFVYEWKGYAGFSLIQTMFVGEVTHLNSYLIQDELYVTVAIESGHSRLLKVVSQGKHIIKNLKIPTVDAQKDEAWKDKKSC